jgi:hypothetical protein
MKGDAGRRGFARENLLYFAFFSSFCQMGIILWPLIRGSGLLLDFCLGSLPFPLCPLEFAFCSACCFPMLRAPRHFLFHHALCSLPRRGAIFTCHLRLAPGGFLFIFGVPKGFRFLYNPAELKEAKAISKTGHKRDKGDIIRVILKWDINDEFVKSQRPDGFVKNSICQARKK